MKVKSVTKKVEIDFSALRESHQGVAALGNGGMNARGDLIGRNGTIVQTAEELERAYFDNNPNAAVNAPISLKDIGSDVGVTPAKALADLLGDQAPEKKPAPTRRRSRETED